MPKIIIFSSNKERFIEKKYNSFYKIWGIQTSFDDLIYFLLKSLSKPINRKDIIEENELTLEYIDCKEKLLLFYYKNH